MKYKDLSPQDSYFHQWTTYRKLNRLVAILFIAFVPAMLLIGIPLGSVFGENKGMFIVFSIWAAFGPSDIQQLFSFLALPALWEVLSYGLWAVRESNGQKLRSL